MIEPRLPADEKVRLEALHALQILDSSPEERFDRLTRMAKRMFGVPISLVSLVDTDRQWFKSKQGLDASETPRNISFCGHAILGDDIFDIPNALNDKRFHDNPLVTEAPHIRFYAGCPVRSASGYKLGTICLIDDQPRELTDEDRLLLKDLALMVEQEIMSVQLATLDELTALNNRRGFMSLAGHLFANCVRNEQAVSLLFFDLNKFKPINDEYGHAEGDRALGVFADILRNSFRQSDVVSRLGGDEFVAFLSDANLREAKSALKRVEQQVSDYNKSNVSEWKLEFSVGHISAMPQPGDSVEQLLEKADKEMYRNKKSRDKYHHH